MANAVFNATGVRDFAITLETISFLGEATGKARPSTVAQAVLYFLLRYPKVVASNPREGGYFRLPFLRPGSWLLRQRGKGAAGSQIHVAGRKAPCSCEFVMSAVAFAPSS